MDKVEELTAAVFATQAPRWTDFFPADSIDIDKAKGERRSSTTPVRSVMGVIRKVGRSCKDQVLRL